jgi:hypothetical protein
MPHRLTTPATPEAWLLLLRCQQEWLVYGVYDAPDHPELLQSRADALKDGCELRIECDDPALVVVHHGLSTHTPSWLRARDNWFLRYSSQLEPYLVDPRTAQAFTFETGKMSDPLSSFKPKRGGPCPLPRGTPWPACRFCSTPMVTVGVLDFREFTEVRVPKGSLVVHGCPACGFLGNEETWAVHWLIEGEPLDIHGDATADVDVGTRWWITDYPTPPGLALEELEESLRNPGSFLKEQSLYFNFTTSFDKVGGHVFWIQDDDELADTSCVFIGELTGDDESLRSWDSPVVYLMYSPTTGKTIASVQSF